jgi:hypothetical protein
MLNVKLLTRGFLFSSFLASLSSAHAMFDEGDRIPPFNISTLQKGYELGLEGKTLEFEGKKYFVKNTSSYIPYFPHYLNEHEISSGYSNQDKEFFFSYSEGGPAMRWNPETQQMEEDPYYPPSGIEHFNLTVKRVLEEPKSDAFVIESSISALSNDRKELSESVDIVSKKTSSLNINSAVQDMSIVREEKKNKILYTIFKEPDVNKNTSEKNLYVEFNHEKNYYIGMELLSPQNVGWWNQRLGYDAYMQYGKEVEMIKEIERNTTQEQQAAAMEINKSYIAAMNSMSGTSMSYSTSTRHEAEDFFDLRHSAGIFDNEYENLVQKQESYSTSGDYLGAWRGFKYNLDHYSIDSPTWVAYVSSKPIEDLLYKNVSVISPDIKMAMTVKISKSFYTPLGIYNCPIAKAFDKEMGNVQYEQLSMPTHSAVARFVGQINPEVEDMVVRPLKPMGIIFKKSGLEFSESNGFPQNINYPYIGCTLPFSHRWYDEKDVKGKEAFGNAPFVIVKPRTNELHEISADHWFSQSPFLGGVTREKIEAFPFVTVNRQSLYKL